ncbi:DUF4912 domain-containing protein [Desulforamulus aquiferis]|uniref:DUF4912 domain-containing protein n=1 Tax=Desulforamulus aquiferis TaxID=1397668 RepID=A0AAW7ZIH1_9FIRM|nr:DUF4912 domain-containing protein [Desulforamulus aquiferis]MDO7788475.1 DUF4912 domain-containing protein [Desulforamulus aquiferis]RYD05632.1 hypothetical protein N752_06985 [Desulforamulus aquiferis]
MDNLWPWLIGVAVAAVIAALILPIIRRTTPKKPELPEAEEEYAEEIFPVAVQLKPKVDDGPHIPHDYGIDRLVLTAKDPNWLHAYWEISTTRQNEFTNLYGAEFWHSSKPIIRVYEVVGMPDSLEQTVQSFRELFLNPWADNWFIEVGKPDRKFYVEYGRLLPSGKYVPILRSNTVTTPRATISDRIDEEWMWIEGIYQYIGQVKYGMSSPVLTERQIIAGIESIVPSGISSPGLEK